MNRVPEILDTGRDRRILAPLWRSQLGATAASLLFATSLWTLLSNTVVPFLPSPYAVGDAFIAALGMDEFYSNFVVTARRLLIAWGAAMLIGTGVGIFMARNWIAETMLHPWVFIGLALPGPVTILLVILVLGLGELTPLIAIWLGVVPFATIFAYDGSRNLSAPLFEAATILRFSQSARLRHVVLPQLAPMLFSSARFCFASAWKITVLVESLASSTGVGQQLRTFFAVNEPANVIAWTLGFTLIMVIVEYGLFQTLDRHLFRWRRAALA